MELHFSKNAVRDYLTVIFRHKRVIVATIITVMVTTIIGWELMTPVYKAQVKMLVTSKKDPLSLFNKEFVGYQQTIMTLTQSEIVNSTPIMERVVKALKLHERPANYEEEFFSPFRLKVKKFFSPFGLRVKKFFSPFSALLKSVESKPERGILSPEQKQAYAIRMAVAVLKRNIKVEPIRDTDLFTINAKDVSPDVAAMIANVVSRSYIIFEREQELADQKMQYGEKYQTVVQLRDTLEKMVANLTGASYSDTVEATGYADVKIVEPAEVPFEPSGANKYLVLAVALVMSICLGVGLAFGFEYIDQTFKSPHDVEAFFNLPLLGSIPKRKAKSKAFINDIQQITPYTQAYQHLADQIYLVMKDKNFRSILVTAASPSEESSLVVSNICAYLSGEAGHKVLVIDANITSPEIHKNFNISHSVGFADVLEGKISFEKAKQDLNSNLTVLPARETTHNPFSLLDSAKLPEIIKEAKEKYEMIFVDYADLRNAKEVYLLNKHVDGIVIVVAEGKTKRPVIKTLIAPLEQKKCNVIGVILNNRTFAIPKILYNWT